MVRIKLVVSAAVRVSADGHVDQVMNVNVKDSSDGSDDGDIGIVPHWQCVSAVMVMLSDMGQCFGVYVSDAMDMFWYNGLDVG